MKLLFISQVFPYPPYRDGARLKVYNLIKCLSKYSEIYFITFIEPKEKEYVDKIQQFCEKIVFVQYEDKGIKRIFKFIHDALSPKRFQSFLMKNEIDIAVKEWNPDVVHVDLPLMSQYYAQLKNIPKVIASHDVISLYAYKNFKASRNILRKIMWFCLYKQRINIERNCYPKFDVCTVVSNEDKEFLQKHCPNLHVKVIPNGVDVEYFNIEKKVKIDIASIGLFGGMDFYPNEDASIYFINDIFPLVKKKIPEVKLYLVGRNPTERLVNFVKNEKDVIMTGEVGDIREYYKKVSVIVSPIRLGSGIKNTVLQAMAMSKAIVATNQAVKAIDAENGKDVLIADEPEQFAENVIKLLNNQELKNELEKNARKLVVDKYSWKAHAEKFQKIYSDIRLK